MNFSIQLQTPFKHFKLMRVGGKSFFIKKEKVEIRRECVEVISVENILYFSFMEVYGFSFCLS